MRDVTRGPSPIAIEQCIAAYQRARFVIHQDEQLGEDENALGLALESVPLALTPDELVQRFVYAISVAEARAAEAHALADRLKARMQRYQRRSEMLRAELVAVMEALQRKTTYTAFGTVSLLPGKQGARITDPDKLPVAYVQIETVRTPLKAAILEDLLEGLVIPGAELSNAVPYVRIVRDKPVETSA